MNLLKNQSIQILAVGIIAVVALVIGLNHGGVQYVTNTIEKVVGAPGGGTSNVDSDLTLCDGCNLTQVNGTTTLGSAASTGELIVGGWANISSAPVAFASGEYLCKFGNPTSATTTLEYIVEITNATTTPVALILATTTVPDSVKLNENSESIASFQVATSGKAFIRSGSTGSNFVGDIDSSTTTLPNTVVLGVGDVFIVYGTTTVATGFHDGSLSTILNSSFGGNFAGNCRYRTSD